MNRRNCKTAIVNYYLNLLDQEIINKMPANKKINNEVDKIRKVFKSGKYIDQNWLIYDKNIKVLYDNVGSFISLLSQGFVNEANQLVDSLIEITV